MCGHLVPSFLPALEMPLSLPALEMPLSLLRVALEMPSSLPALEMALQMPLSLLSEAGRLASAGLAGHLLEAVAHQFRGALPGVVRFVTILAR